MHKTLGLKLTTIMMTTPFSIQAQAAEDGRGRWWLWLVLLLALSVVVAWLLGREAGRQEAMTVTARPTPKPVGQAATGSAPTARLGTAAAALASEAALLAEPEAPASESSPALAPTPVAAAEPDDLTQIEGIGPKISSVLQAAGIATFADLAAADTAHLKQILVDAGLRIHNPSTWPEQAALARAGRWEDLKAFKSQLNAGRRN